LTDDELLARFRLLRAGTHPTVRTELIDEFTGLAAYLARRYHGRGVPREDLQQIALVGLMLAVDRFDPDHGARFASFAGRTIDGELKRFFRDRTWAVRMPRRMQELQLSARRANETLTHRLGRVPTVAELAVEMGVELDDAVAALDAGSAYRADSLDRRSFDADDDAEAGPHVVAPDAEAGFDAIEYRSVVDELLATLPERERRIVQLRFFEERTQAEIAAELGISQMHVSRLLRRSVEILRRRLHT